MARRYHINPKTGRPNICHAKTPERCIYAKDGQIPEHYDSKEEAREAYEKQMESEMVSSVSSRDTVTYSFLEDFREKEQEFDEEFAGIPARFFSTDLANGKGAVEPKEYLDVNSEAEMGVHTRVMQYQSGEISLRLMQAASSPSQDSNVHSEFMREALSNLGATDVRELTEEEKRSFIGPREALLCRVNGQNVLVFDGTYKKNGGRYIFRRNSPIEGVQSFISLNARSVAGAARVQKLTGENVLRTAVGSSVNDATETYRALKKNGVDIRRARELSVLKGLSTAHENYKTSYNALRKLEDAQYRGNAFQAQKKYVRESGGKIATVWDDKKNPLPSHVNAARNSSLNRHFRKLEIDNDVSLEEFKDFEESFQEIHSKLPPLPDDRKPELRIRKLGKHGAIGLYSPVHNTVAIDVRTSGAMIHELGHYYDIAGSNNASVRDGFHSIVRDYDKSLPKDMTLTQRRYLTTPSEVLARGFEHYAHERLGIKNNRVLDERRFKDADHTPFRNSPELKKRVFDFIDKHLYGKN